MEINEMVVQEYDLNVRSGTRLLGTSSGGFLHEV